MSRDYSVPNCPWCGMASRVPPEHHHEWETVHMACGSEIYPPRATSPSEQSEACKRLAEMTADRDRLAAELARVRRNHLRRMDAAILSAWHNVTERRKTGRVASRYLKILEAVRAALAQPQDGTTEGRG